MTLQNQNNSCKHDKVHHDAIFISKCTCSAAQQHFMVSIKVLWSNSETVCMLFAKNKQPQKQIKLPRISTQDANANRKLKVTRR